MSKANPTHSTLLPEVTSKAPRIEEEDNESVETLTEKLSAAILNSSAKDELVKQHAKVTEEAVSGLNFFWLSFCSLAFNFN